MTDFVSDDERRVDDERDETDDRVVASYLFDPENLTAPDEATKTISRIVWMLVQFVRSGSVAYGTYYREFERSTQTFRRDLRRLRDLGGELGFTLGRIRRGTVRLEGMRDVDLTPRRGERERETLRALVRAFGRLVGAPLALDPDDGDDGFLAFAEPRLVAASDVADRYAELRAAWRARAKVRFRYHRGPNAPKNAARVEERIVEPHRVTYYDGRFYLVAFDTRPATNDWRQFALDRIGEIAPAGTFVRRVVPAHYDGRDAIGLFKTSSPRVTVTIAFSPVVATAVVARLWQREQVVHPAVSGTWTHVDITVGDIGEAVRWAFGFGDEALVVAPPTAVVLAAELAERLSARCHAAREALPSTAANVRSTNPEPKTIRSVSPTRR